MSQWQPVEPAEANEKKDCGNDKGEKPAHLDKRSQTLIFDSWRLVYDI